MAAGGNGDRRLIRHGDQEVRRGRGGETHQSAGDGRPRLTTAQGVPVADDQNTLRAGEHRQAPCAWPQLPDGLLHGVERGLVSSVRGEPLARGPPAKLYLLGRALRRARDIHVDGREVRAPPVRRAVVQRSEKSQIHVLASRF